jgi:hypothetical protein
MQVSNLVRWVDLSLGPEKWADIIIEQLSYSQRSNMSEYLTLAGYNVALESKKLERRYLELIQ